MKYLTIKSGDISTDILLSKENKLTNFKTILEKIYINNTISFHTLERLKSVNLINNLNHNIQLSLHSIH